MTRQLLSASLLLFAVSASVGVLTLQGQTAPLPTGSVGTPVALHHCPAGFYPGPENQTVCYQATVNCPNTSAINVIFGYLAPPPPVIGTIALFSGFGGTKAYNLEEQEPTSAADYYGKGYAVVQSEWSYDWEDTNGPLPQPIYPYNILTAACRPATLLAYLSASSQFNPKGKMCAQGHSAGGGEIAYSLVWYGAGSYLKAVEMLSGPELADLQIGCQVPPALNGQPVSLCALGQGWCSLGTLNEVATLGPWNTCPQFIDVDATAVEGWTGNLGIGNGESCNNAGNGGASCSGGTGTNTSGNNSAWKLQSILNGQGGSFTYPALTEMGGWMCYNFKSTCPPNATCPNNSAAQGWQYYEQISDGIQPHNFLVTGIQSCPTAEGVPAGISPDGGASGQVAVETRMEAFCK